MGIYLEDKFLEVKFLDQSTCAFIIVINIAMCTPQEAIPKKVLQKIFPTFLLLCDPWQSERWKIEFLYSFNSICDNIIDIELIFWYLKAI